MYRLHTFQRVIMLDDLDNYAQQTTDTKTRCKVCNAPDAVRETVEANELRPKALRKERRTVVAWARDRHAADISVDSIYKHMAYHYVFPTEGTVESH